MMKTNQEIQEVIKRASVKKWQVASCLGIADTTFSRLLRFELSDDKKAEVLAAIEKAKVEFK